MFYQAPIVFATVTYFPLVSGASGHVAAQGTVYATTHDLATGNVAGNSSPNIQNEWFSPNYLIMRAPLIFDTATLLNQVVDSAYLLTRCSGTTRSSAGSSATIVQYIGSGTTISSSQYDKTLYGVTSGGTQLLTAWASCAVDVQFPLNALGTSWISTTTLTKLALRDSGDINSTIPSGIQSRLAFEDTNNKIVLVVTHHDSEATSTATSTEATLNDVVFGIGILVTVSGMIFGTIIMSAGKKK